MLLFNEYIYVPVILSSGVNCGPPGDALNTLPVVVTDTLFGDTVNYQCLTGYVISEGVTTGDIVCQANATWSQKPDCLRMCSHVIVYILTPLSPKQS